MKKYIKQHGQRLGIAVLVVAIIFGVSTRLLGGRGGLLSNMTAALRTPTQQAVGSVASWLEGIYGNIYQYEQLMEENESLRRDMAHMQDAVRAAGEVAEENARFRELLGFLERHKDFDTESAYIVSWEVSNWMSAFTISKGEESGIALGDCVIDSTGALVGQIISLGDGWATVRTVIDTNMDVGVLVGELSGAAMLTGDFGLMQEGCTKLAYLAEGTQLFVDDHIVTSGKGGRFPQGVTVGVVRHLRTEAAGQTTFGVVEPACDLSRLSQVFVIKDFAVVE